MIILTLRTDKPDAEIGLYDGRAQIAYIAWEAHRQLAETIHLKIAELLSANGYELNKLRGIVVFQGPGSFTGLRIGITVANALADALKLPIVGTARVDWIDDGIDQLMNGKDDKLVLPEYGALPNVSTPKK
jgi:tRNA threonylcarbamoyladenosine biosynthesis protein TsaB